MGLKCPECQFDNLDESRFCSRCATPLMSPEEISASPTKTLETPITGLTRSSTFAQRYEVIEELDKGGMGKIYRVFDKKIELEVALKLLRPEIAADSDTITRFKNELKFARKIAHRNVCRMYDLGEEGNAYYITMEYISGESLKSSVRRMERLTVKKAISIAKQVCEGLAEAHRLGVVHRDLKPGNIMIDSDGNARILDFGIARSLRSKGMTGAGVMIGTPEYMSPEQVDGEEADQRSDIYSLGVILYEMVTGKVPFKGDTPISVAVKHKLEIPPSPKKENPLIPEDLNRMIMRCLEKNQEKRYQRADELFAALVNIEKEIPLSEKVGLKKKRRPRMIAKPSEIRWKKAVLRGVIVGSVLIVLLMVFLVWFGKKYLGQFGIQKTIDSIAVLPLRNLTGKPELGFFADRMTEALIDELTKTGTLRHIPPSTSVMQYKTAPKRVTEITGELDVEAVIEWSMVLDKNQVQISLKLIEGKSEQAVWDNIYTRNMQENLTKQTELANIITQEIIVQLTNREMPWVSRRYRSVKPKALELYKKGRYLLDRRPEESLKASEYFEQAIREDSKCALAYAGLAEEIISYIYYHNLSLKKGGVLSGSGKEAKEYAQKALEIDPTLGEAHVSMALVKTFYDWDWEGAEVNYKGAIRRPNFQTAHYWYAIYLMNSNRLDESIEQMNRAIEIDPLSPVVNYGLGRVYYFARRYDQAIDAFLKAIELSPNFYRVHHHLGMAYLQKPIYEKAFEEFQKEKEVSAGTRGWDSNLEASISIAYMKMGKKDKARECLEELLKRGKDSYSMASVYFALGEKDKGFEWLEEEFKSPSSQIFLLRIDPVFDSVRDDLRFKEMLKKVGLE